jgi:hypothetical protein
MAYVISECTPFGDPAELISALNHFDFLNARLLIIQMKRNYINNRREMYCN